MVGAGRGGRTSWVADILVATLIVGVSVVTRPPEPGPLPLPRPSSRRVGAGVPFATHLTVPDAATLPGIEVRPRGVEDGRARLHPPTSRLG